MWNILNQLKTIIAIWLLQNILSSPKITQISIGGMNILFHDDILTIWIVLDCLKAFLPDQQLIPLEALVDHTGLALASLIPILSSSSTPSSILSHFSPSLSLCVCLGLGLWAQYTDSKKWDGNLHVTRNCSLSTSPLNSLLEKYRCVFKCMSNWLCKMIRNFCVSLCVFYIWDEDITVLKRQINLIFSWEFDREFRDLAADLI